MCVYVRSPRYFLPHLGEERERVGGGERRGWEEEREEGEKRG